MTDAIVYDKHGDDHQTRLVSPALINSVQIGICVNAIAPDQPSAFSKKFLRDKYQITGNDSLMRRINEFFYHFNDDTFNAPTRFASVTHSTVFAKVAQSFYVKYGNPSAARKALEDAAYDTQSFIDFSYLRRFDVFMQALDVINKKGLLPSGIETLTTVPVDAYYDGLTVTLIRMGVGAGYLTAAEAQELLTDILDTIVEQYLSWQDFTAGYMIGRAAFTDYTIEEVANIALKCIEKPQSPWNRVDVFRAKQLFS
jgi:hypothetical protein